VSLKTSVVLARTCPAYRVDIFVGSKRGYKDSTDDDLAKYYEMIQRTCQEFCDDVGLCVHIEKVDYVYTQGSEPGVKVVLINYPRFPKATSTIDQLARTLASELLIQSHQERVTVITPTESYLLENEVTTQ